jgi:hypothetical protein
MKKLPFLFIFLFVLCFTNKSNAQEDQPKQLWVAETFQAGVPKTFEIGYDHHSLPLRLTYTKYTYGSGDLLVVGENVGGSGEVLPNTTGEFLTYWSTGRAVITYISSNTGYKVFGISYFWYMPQYSSLLIASDNFIHGTCKS